MAATDGGRSGRLDGVVLGLLADPDLPAELAERLAGELPELLAERLDDQVSWQIRVGCERFDLADEERIMAVAREDRAREGWDLVVCLTDLPRRIGLRPIVAEASLTDGVALASLPALGARQLYQRVREMVIGLVEELDRERLALPQAGHERPSTRRPGSWPPSGGWSQPIPTSMCVSSSLGSAVRQGCWPAWSAPTAPGG